jgi:uncharacterized membrane protein YtjA (UPF0391 family)
MLHWSLMLLVFALVSGYLGFYVVAGTAAGIAKILFFSFLAMAALSFLFGRRGATI